MFFSCLGTNEKKINFIHRDWLLSNVFENEASRTNIFKILRLLSSQNVLVHWKSGFVQNDIPNQAAVEIKRRISKKKVVE